MEETNVGPSDTNDEDSDMRPRSLSQNDKHLLSGGRFDVFLSFAEKDAEFAKEIQLRLSPRAGVRVYFPSEAMMPGKAFCEEIADKIKRGCRKTLIILSPDYLKTPWCRYEACLALDKNPG